MALDATRGLKPRPHSRAFGMTEVMPCYKSSNQENSSAFYEACDFHQREIPGDLKRSASESAGLFGSSPPDPRDRTGDRK